MSKESLLETLKALEGAKPSRRLLMLLHHVKEEKLRDTVIYASALLDMCGGLLDTLEKAAGKGELRLSGQMHSELAALVGLLEGDVYRPGIAEPHMIHLVFTSGPGPSKGDAQFVELNNSEGRSRRVGEWVYNQKTGFTELQIPVYGYVRGLNDE